MNSKSTSCFSRRTGKPLTNYRSEHEAIEGAAYASTQYKNNMIPYQCRDCNFWHLSPKERHTPSKICYYCIDRYGNYKDLYYSKESAKKRAYILYKEQGMKLEIYECPHNEGWHLTKK